MPKAGSIYRTYIPVPVCRYGTHTINGRSTRSLFRTSWGVPVAIMGLRFLGEMAANTLVIHQTYMSLSLDSWAGCAVLPQGWILGYGTYLQLVPCILYPKHVVHVLPFCEWRWVLYDTMANLYPIFTGWDFFSNKTQHVWVRIQLPRSQLSFIYGLMH